MGAELAKKFSVRLGISLHDAELISWLVLNHLNFSKTAQHHNLNDTAVIEEFSKFIGDRQRLVYLFLLTPDVAAVGPGPSLIEAIYSSSCSVNRRSRTGRLGCH